MIFPVPGDHIHWKWTLKVSYLWTSPRLAHFRWTRVHRPVPGSPEMVRNGGYRGLTTTHIEKLQYLLPRDKAFLGGPRMMPPQIVGVAHTFAYRGLDVAYGSDTARYCQQRLFG